VNLLDGKSALITGATGGIGYETALGLARLGAHIYLHGRSTEMVATARARLSRALPNAQITPLYADFADLSEVRRLSTELKSPLDILVNNAGCWTAARAETRDGFEMQFGVNHLAPFLLTELLLPKLAAAKAARIVMVSSTMHQRGMLDFDDLMQTQGRYNGVKAYANSKLCNLLMMTELATRLPDSILINALHPGAVATDIARAGGAIGFLLRLGRPFLLSPAQGARTSLYLANNTAITTRGDYYENEQKSEMLKCARDLELAHRLYRVSAELTGIQPVN
jgi:NAD(P)-dependent dehydrogenase (short-subunit alcohol dehydrogenase family)